MSYIVEGFESDGLNEAINSSSAKKLILELNFKYGLKVLSYEPASNLFARCKFPSFLMTESTGAFAVAKVWADKEDEADVFNFRSPYYRKERGSDTADRETVHSKKLSTLMATLKRQDVVPSFHELLKRTHFDNFLTATSSVRESFGRIGKNNNLSGEELHEVLKHIFLGETPNPLLLNNCKEILDRFDQSDKIKVDREIKVNELFGNGFYAIGADNHSLVIGKLKYASIENKDRFEIIEPFKRAKDLSNYEHLQAPLLMQKVVCENKGIEKFYQNFIPSKGGYLPDLDMLTVMTRFPDDYNLVWTLLPCSTV